MTCQLQVGDHLCLVHGEQVLDALYLKNDAVLDYEVESVSARDVGFSIHEGDGNLMREGKSSRAKLARQARVVRRLKQAGADGSVYRDRTTNHALRNRVSNEHA
jgi:hypothetical protein